MARQKARPRMPRGVQRRIVRRSAKNEVSVVVPRDGRPARVFKLEKYLKMMEQPKKHKPWTHRNEGRKGPDPLGAAEGKVLMPLTREKIYSWG